MRLIIDYNPETGEIIDRLGHRVGRVEHLENRLDPIQIKDENPITHPDPAPILPKCLTIEVRSKKLKHRSYLSGFTVEEIVELKKAEVI